MRVQLDEAPDNVRGIAKRNDAIVKICDEFCNDTDAELWNYAVDAFYFFDAAYFYPDLDPEEIVSMACDGFAI